MNHANTIMQNCIPDVPVEIVDRLPNKTTLNLLTVSLFSDKPTIRVHVHNPIDNH